MLEPLGSCLLVKPDESESETKSGLVLPDAAKDRPQKGIVIGVGPKVEDDRLTEGCKVVYSKYGGTEIDHDGEEIIVLREADLIAIEKEKS